MKICPIAKMAKAGSKYKINALIYQPNFAKVEQNSANLVTLCRFFAISIEVYIPLCKFFHHFSLIFFTQMDKWEPKWAISRFQLAVKLGR